MALHDVASVPLLSFNVSAAAGIAFVNPLLAQFDLALTGSFGLGSIQADLAAQFNAAISATAQINLAISDPFLSFSVLLSAIGTLAASISAALAAGLPTMSLELSGQIAAAASLVATLSAKLGGINLLLSAALRVKLPAVKFFADLAANLGEVHVLSFDQTPTSPYTLAMAGADIDSLFSTGLTGILPTDSVYGVMIVMKDPATWLQVKAMFMVA